MSTTCPRCMKPLDSGARFCGACGTEQVSVRPPAAEPADQLGLEVDLSTIRHFVAGSRCLIRLRVSNRGALAWDRLLLDSRLADEAAIEQVELSNIGASEHDVAHLRLTPRIAGFHRLEGELTTVDPAGKQHAYRFEPMRFRVGEAGTAGLQVVNIDQRSARVVDNSRSRFASTPERGGVLGEAEWSPVSVAEIRPGSGAEAAAPAASSGARGAFVIRAEERQYHLVDTIARGDLATIYRGRDQDDEPVVLKIADDASDNDLIGREARALRLFGDNPGPQCKHLPRFRDQFRTADGKLGSVLSWIDAEDLCSVRETHAEGLGDEPATWIFRRALSALGFAHRLGVVHGNIEPAHLMVDARDHNIFLIDWCYAAVRPAETGDGFVCLNELYSPPEVAERKPPIPASDLYSLAKTMVYLLGGDVEAETLPPRVDERLARLLRYFLRQSPMQRPQDAWEMYDQLDVLRRELFGEHQFRELVL